MDLLEKKREQEVLSGQQSLDAWETKQKGKQPAGVERPGEVQKAPEMVKKNRDETILVRQLAARQKKQELFDRAQYESYHSVYTEKKSAGKRARAVKNQKSRLFAKNELAKLATEKQNEFKEWERQSSEVDLSAFQGKLEDADEAYLRTFLFGTKGEEKQTVSDVIIASYAEGNVEGAMDSMYEMLSSSELLRMDIRRDSDVVEHLPEFFRISEQVEAFRFFLEKNADYWEDFTDAKKKEIDGTLGKLELISEYGKTRYDIIVNPYYRNHYNDEIGFSPQDDATDEQRELSADLVKCFYLQKKMASSGIAVPAPQGELMTATLRELPQFREKMDVVNRLGQSTEKKMQERALQDTFGKVNGILLNMINELRLRGMSAIYNRSTDDQIAAKYQESEANGYELQKLSDKEACRKILSVNANDPGFKQHIVDLFYDMKTLYKVSPEIYRTMEGFLGLFSQQKKYEDSLIPTVKMQEKIAQDKARIESYKVAANPEWKQREFQHYGNSCWAVSSSNIVNVFNQTYGTNMPLVDQEFALNTNGNAPHVFNEKLKDVAFAGVDEEMLLEFTEEKMDVNQFRMDPNAAPGSVFAMADYLLEATGNKAMVKAKNYNVRQDLGMPLAFQEARAEVVKERILEDMHHILTEEKAPISILYAGHFLTVVGMEGRNLICKDSYETVNHTQVDENVTLDIDTLYDQNQRTGMLQIAWLQEVNPETIATLKKEIPEAKDFYEARSKDQLHPKDEFTPSEYAHAKGIDVKHRDENDEYLGNNEVQTLAYLPKGLQL